MHSGIACGSRVEGEVFFTFAYKSVHSHNEDWRASEPLCAGSQTHALLHNVLIAHLEHKELLRQEQHTEAHLRSA